MKPYNPHKRYLGPENKPYLNKFIFPFPPGIPELKDSWNQAAYGHDSGYEGDIYAGWLGWIKKWLNRKQAEKNRAEVDDKFYRELCKGIIRIKGQITRDQEEEAYAYAKVVYIAVQKAGWSFYKVGS